MLRGNSAQYAGLRTREGTIDGPDIPIDGAAIAVSGSAALAAEPEFNLFRTYHKEDL
ncbi:MAG: hypothetical protein LBD08_04070 [Treponema sp.]|nr:hypothetical protein [Treponema sp.]